MYFLLRISALSIAFAPMISANLPKFNLHKRDAGQTTITYPVCPTAVTVTSTSSAVATYCPESIGTITQGQSGQAPAIADSWNGNQVIIQVIINSIGMTITQGCYPTAFPIPCPSKPGMCGATYTLTEECPCTERSYQAVPSGFVATVEHCDQCGLDGAASTVTKIVPRETGAYATHTPAIGPCPSTATDNHVKIIAAGHIGAESESAGPAFESAGAVSGKAGAASGNAGAISELSKSSSNKAISNPDDHALGADNSVLPKTEQSSLMGTALSGGNNAANSSSLSDKPGSSSLGEDSNNSTAGDLVSPLSYTPLNNGKRRLFYLWTLVVGAAAFWLATFMMFST